MIEWLEFIEAPVFTRLLSRYLTDDDYRELQLHLARDPEAETLSGAPGAFARCAGGTAGEAGPRAAA